MYRNFFIYDWKKPVEFCYDTCKRKSDDISAERNTCCVKAVFPPGIGKLDGAIGRRSRGEPVLFLLSVRE